MYDLSLLSMRNPIINGSSDIKMTMSHQDASGESRIDKMRKFLSSPLTRKKPNGNLLKTFGAPLDALIQKSPSEMPVPFVVTRICQYIEHDGLMHEGVFRISGNARLIERLKTCFDHTGDAPLETEGDVPSAAALLKLFFRELPDPIIPLHMHQQFLNAVKGSDRQESITELAVLVEKLPLVNFSVLKYLSYFLTSVCEFESQNRMSASSLGIVFGPNLFRVTDDFVGLKEQSLTNQIVTYFITDYYAIFHDEPKYYKKNLSSSVDAKQSKMSISATDSMVASWPKLSAFPSLASSLNLRPLSVSIPTMGGSGFPLGSYAEPLDNQEHILMVDRHEVGEDSLGNEQISDQSEKEESRDGCSSMQRGRKEQKTINDDGSDASASYEEVTALESKRYWKDLYFIDDADESVDQKEVPKSSLEIKISPSKQHDQSIPIEAEHFHHRPFSLVSTDACKDEGIDRNIPSYLLKNENNFQTANDEMYKMDSTIEMLHGNISAVEDVSTSHMHQKLNTDHSFSKEFKVLADENNATTETIQDAREFPIDLRDDRPAREKRFGRSHKHYQRSGHRSYYRKKKHSGEGKRIAPSQEFLHDSKNEEGRDSPQRGFESDLTSTHPPTDLPVTSDAFCENNGSSSDQRYSWPVLKGFHEDEMEKLSPARQFLRLSGNSGAPLSPSAYRSYLSHRSPHLDSNLPPSPPVEQEDLATGPMDDVTKPAAKLLSRKIQSLKKKIKRFEENFEASHGFRPSHAEKSQYSDVKKFIEELHRARQDLKQLKEEETVSDILLQQQWTPSPENLPVPSQKYNKSTNTFRHGANQGFVLKDGTAVTIEQSLEEGLEYLAEKRKANQRPETLEDMSKEQLTDEKLSIQKLLLQFESIHGRPSSKTQRDTMRPLYDRYRCAKRILGRSASFGSTSKLKDATELQPILEHETMDFRSASAKDLSLKEEEEEEIVNNGNIVEKNENEIDKEINYDLEPVPSPKDNLKYDNTLPVFEITKSNLHPNVHELSLPELFEQQQQARAEKRKLRRILREFELEFQKEKGRKVQREDKVEMESVYSAYKHVRARLKLLEALAAKHGQRSK